MKASEIAKLAFPRVLKANGLPPATTEYRFAPPRRWRFDYAWPDKMVALEVEGGIHSRGRHVRGAGYEKDMEKYSEAAIRGWCVIRVTPAKLCHSSTMEMIRRARLRFSPPFSKLVGLSIVSGLNRR